MNVGTWLAVAAVALAALVFLKLRSRGAAGTRTKKRAVVDALDTVASWPPEATRILGAHERQAYKALAEAFPDHMLLAQVPLARFLKVPRRHSYGEWFNRVGQLNADLLLCDRSSQVIAAIEIHSPNDSERSKQRHDRMARVLKAAGIRCVVWKEGAIPTPEAAREQLLPPQPAQLSSGAPTKPAPTLPVLQPEEEELGPAAEAPVREPMPSTWFDEFDSGPIPLAKAGRR